MDSEVTFLMLIEMAFKNHGLLVSKRMAISEAEKRSGRTLREISGGFITKGITVSVAIRVGEPAQELVKFLAERPPYQALIWGSSEALPLQGSSERRHWITRVVNTLECPIFTVSSKEHPGLTNRI
jgi:hypothetical protein